MKEQYIKLLLFFYIRYKVIDIQYTTSLSFVL